MLEANPCSTHIKDCKLFLDDDFILHAAACNVNKAELKRLQRIELLEKKSNSDGLQNCGLGATGVDRCCARPEPKHRWNSHCSAVCNSGGKSVATFPLLSGNFEHKLMSQKSMLLPELVSLLSRTSLVCSHYGASLTD